MKLSKGKEYRVSVVTHRRGMMLPPICADIVMTYVGGGVTIDGHYIAKGKWKAEGFGADSRRVWTDLPIVEIAEIRREPYSLGAAVRAFERIWARIDAELEVASEADAGFDAGEWSGPAHANIYQRRYEEVTDHVANRFGLSTYDLAIALHRAPYAEHDHWADSVIKGKHK